MRDKFKYTGWVIVGILAAFLLPSILGWATGSIFGITQTQTAEQRQLKSYKKIDYTELTAQQRIEDLDYFLNMAKTTLPYIYEMDECYSYSFLDRESDYREMIAACENDYQFMAAMFTIICDIPSGHSSFALPDFSDYFYAGYFRTDTIGLSLTDNLQGKIEACYNYLCECQKKYDDIDYSGVVFNYYDGNYVCTSGSLTLYDSVIKSIDGRDPSEYLANTPALMGDIEYDCKNAKTFREDICFSTVGEHSAQVTVELSDGTEMTLELYTDSDYCFSLYYGYFFRKTYVDSNDDELFVTAPDADDNSVTIYTDEEYNLAYVMLSSVNFSDGTAVYNKLRDISGYENIVIDMRGNGGGISSFWDNYIYPALYKDDAYFEVNGIMPDNEYTDGLFAGIFKGHFSMLLSDMDFSRAKELPSGMYDCNGGKYKQYTFSHTMTGNPALSYSDSRNVYYIVNNHTCSAADEIVQMVKSCDLGTVVGTNTKGEGLVFGVCCDWLPNSLLMYYYCPTYVVDGDGTNNNLYGTQPDLWGGTSAQGVIISNEMDLEGIDSLDPKYRREWDNNYKIILQDIDSRTAIAA